MFVCIVFVIFFLHYFLQLLVFYMVYYNVVICFLQWLLLRFDQVGVGLRGLGGPLGFWFA